MMRLVPLAALLALSMACQHDPARFSMARTDSRLTILEDGEPVLAYNFGHVDPPAGVDADRFWRSSYIHPLYGLDGQVVTDDFPQDHYHHRGVFWTWPEMRVGSRKMDVWTIVGARQLFQKWLRTEVTADRADVGVENAWFFEDDPEPKVRESIFFTIHPAEESCRAIDFLLRFENVCEEDVSFLGAKNKGYGGFSFRPDADNKPFTFVTAKGVSPEDALRFETPWAGINWKRGKNSVTSGVAIFQHPGNPGFPHPGWMFRHYGFLGASWPHEQRHVLQPGDSFELRYRLIVHHGGDTEQLLGDLFDQYLEGEK